MKKVLYAVMLLLGSSIMGLTSCENNLQDEREQDDGQTVSVSITYKLNTDIGQPMAATKADVDVFNEFYAKIIDGTLIAPSYNLTFTEVNSGTEYTVDGTWDSSDMVSLRTGTYRVKGVATASGDNIQDKCSIILDDEITIDTQSTTVAIKADYDCALLVFSDTSIESISNFNGNSETPLFKFSNYFYAFINTTLYSPDSKDAAYLSGTHTNGTTFKITTGNLSFEKGKYYVYNDISASFDLPEMEPGDHNDNNTVVDLSKNGTANCYIVPSAGTYKFNASVQGNSLDPVGNITEADVVWETLNTPESISVGDVINSVSLSDDGYVIFDATGTYGNALIAVKDKNGTILWSWHIWVTDYNPDEDYDVYVGKENYKIMDRNLGALSNTPGDSRALGLIYQWGRKEPFMNKNYISTDDNLQFITSNNEYGTVEYAIQHPLTYICGHTSFVLDWYDDTPNNTLWSETKSKYDPSPVGWKVPSEDVWANFPNDNTGYDATNKGKLIDERYSNPPTWIPLDNDGREAWQGDWQSENATTFWTTKTGSGSFVYVSRISNDSHSYFAHFRAVAISIRCVKE